MMKVLNYDWEKECFVFDFEWRHENSFATDCGEKPVLHLFVLKISTSIAWNKLFGSYQLKISGLSSTVESRGVWLIFQVKIERDRDLLWRSNKVSEHLLPNRKIEIFNDIQSKILV